MMKFDRLLRPATVVLVCALSTVAAVSAEIGIDPSHGATTSLVLEGEIKSGDFDKFRHVALDGGTATEIYLASPGGNLGEAMKIGFLVRQLNLSTVVPGKPLTNQELVADATRHNLQDVRRDYMCASACFFIFAAGIHRSADGVGSAILGIHRPFLSKGGLERLSPDQAAAADGQARVTIETYLKAMDVPSKYAENMYSVPKGKILWVRNDEFETDFGGFIPELKGLVENRCPDSAAREKGKTTIDQSKADISEGSHVTANTGARIDCERKLQVELAVRAHDDVLSRKTHGDPQSTPEETPKQFR
jgi:hypothetical protein